jgi:hypothetical protein
MALLFSDIFMFGERCGVAFDFAPAERSEGFSLVVGQTPRQPFRLSDVEGQAKS